MRSPAEIGLVGVENWVVPCVQVRHSLQGYHQPQAVMRFSEGDQVGVQR